MQTVLHADSGLDQGTRRAALPPASANPRRQSCLAARMPVLSRSKISPSMPRSWPLRIPGSSSRSGCWETKNFTALLSRSRKLGSALQSRFIPKTVPSKAEFRGITCRARPADDGVFRCDHRMRIPMHLNRMPVCKNFQQKRFGS